MIYKRRKGGDIMNLIFSIMALIGGLLCCVGDILFDLKGKGNQKLGKSKNIDSNWSKMSEWFLCNRRYG